MKRFIRIEAEADEIHGLEQATTIAINAIRENNLVGEKTVPYVNNPTIVKWECSDIPFPENVKNITIYYVYYDASDFTTSCDPIRVDLVIDGICIKSHGTPLYMEHRERVDEYEKYCKTHYPDAYINHLCQVDGREQYKFELQKGKE